MLMKIVLSDKNERFYQVNNIEEISKTLTKCFCPNNIVIIIEKPDPDYNPRVCFYQEDIPKTSAYIGKNQKDIERGNIWIESLEIFTEAMKLLKSYY